MLKLKFDEYDKILETFEKVKTPTYYPDIQDMELFDPNDKDMVMFAVYLYEFGKKPKNQQEEYSRKNLFTFINNNLELID